MTSGVPEGNRSDDIHWSDYVSDEAIALLPEVSSPKKLLQHISELLDDGKDEDLDSDDILPKLLERERLGSTAMGEGIALPHARVEGLLAPRIAILRLTTPIEMHAPDDKPVDIAIGLAIPQDCSELHLKLLASISTNLSNHEYADAIRAQNESDDIAKLIRNWR